MTPLTLEYLWVVVFSRRWYAWLNIFFFSWVQSGVQSLKMAFRAQLEAKRLANASRPISQATSHVQTTKGLSRVLYKPPEIGCVC